jgi:hypothetical protein
MSCGVGRGGGLPGGPQMSAAHGDNAEWAWLGVGPSDTECERGARQLGWLMGFCGPAGLGLARKETIFHFFSE